MRGARSGPIVLDRPRLSSQSRSGRIAFVLPPSYKEAMRFLRACVFIAIAGNGLIAHAEPIDRTPHKSPDGRYVIRYDLEPGTEVDGQLDTSELKGISLRAVGSGKTVATLLPKDAVGTNFHDVQLVWSADSQWCAFYYAHPRVGNLRVFHRVGAKFAEVPSAAKLHVSPSRWLGHPADVRNEYLHPIRWLKPGLLLLEEFSILRGEDEPSDLTLRLTAQYEKGRFRIVSVKEAPPTREFQ